MTDQQASGEKCCCLSALSICPMCPIHGTSKLQHVYVPPKSVQASEERQTWCWGDGADSDMLVNQKNVWLTMYDLPDYLNTLEADRDRAVADAENWRKDVSRWKENFAEVQADRDRLQQELTAATGEHRYNVLAGEIANQRQENRTLKTQLAEVEALHAVQLIEAEQRVVDAEADRDALRRRVAELEAQRDS